MLDGKIVVSSIETDIQYLQAMSFLLLLQKCNRLQKSVSLEWLHHFHQN